MPKIVIKESPSSDFYVEWSSIAEAPTFAGTRAEMLAHLQRDSDPWLRDDAPHHPAQRLKRCDETGTTSRWVTAAGMRDKYPEEGAWDDDSFIYQQEGTVTRADVFVLARRLAAGEDAADLIRPFDDEDESPAESLSV
jgi:hypothetical protein